jgi:hypothetical protein
VENGPFVDAGGLETVLGKDVGSKGQDLMDNKWENPDINNFPYSITNPLLP